MEMVQRRMSCEVDSRVLLLGFEDIVADAVLDHLGLWVLARVKSQTSTETGYTHMSFGMADDHVKYPIHVADESWWSKLIGNRETDEGFGAIVGPP